MVAVFAFGLAAAVFFGAPTFLAVVVFFSVFGLAVAVFFGAAALVVVYVFCKQCVSIYYILDEVATTTLGAAAGLAAAVVGLTLGSFLASFTGPDAPGIQG